MRSGARGENGHHMTTSGKEQTMKTRPSREMKRMKRNSGIGKKLQRMALTYNCNHSNILTSQEKREEHEMGLQFSKDGKIILPKRKEESKTEKKAISIIDRWDNYARHAAYHIEMELKNIRSIEYDLAITTGDREEDQLIASRAKNAWHHAREYIWRAQDEYDEFKKEMKSPIRAFRSAMTKNPETSKAIEEAQEIIKKITDGENPGTTAWRAVERFDNHITKSLARIRKANQKLKSR